MKPTVSSRLASRATQATMPGEAVVDDHEDKHGGERQADRPRPLANRVCAERRPDGVLADRLLARAGRSSAPLRRKFTSSSTLLVEVGRMICPCAVMTALRFGADTILSSRRMARLRMCVLVSGLFRSVILPKACAPAPLKREADAGLNVFGPCRRWP